MIPAGGAGARLPARQFRFCEEPSAAARQAGAALGNSGADFGGRCASPAHPVHRPTMSLAPPPSARTPSGSPAFTAGWYWQTDSRYRINHLFGSPVSRSVLGKRPWELPGLDTLHVGWAQVFDALMARDAFQDAPWRRHDAAGRLHQCLVSGEAVFGSKGRFIGFRGVGRRLAVFPAVAPPAHAGSLGAMPTDHPRLQATLSLLRQLPDTLRASMVGMYLQALDEQLGIIEAGLSGVGDADLLPGALHKIAGSAGMMQDQGLSQAARAIELALRDGQMADARQQWPALAACAVLTREALAPLQAQAGPAG